MDKDKQIIIDGVEVNECAYFLYPLGCNSLDSKTCQCINDDCYYKQFKHKEQECERLKSAFVRAECQIADDEILQCDMRKAIEGLKAKNDYLKHKIFRYEEIFKHSADMIKNPVTAIEVETFQSGVKALGNSLIAEENNKLHKTLTEIKEIAEHCITQDICTFCDYNDKCHIEDEEIPTYDVCKLILQKISEVE